jgi:hypothetical protein
MLAWWDASSSAAYGFKSLQKRSSCREWGSRVYARRSSINRIVSLTYMEISYITTPLGLVVHEVTLSLSFAHVNSDKGSFIAAIMPMLLGICLAPIHCLSSHSLTSNTSREFIVYYVLQDRRPLGLRLVSSNLWRSTTSQTFPAGREDIVLMWRLNVRLHKVAPVDPAL